MVAKIPSRESIRLARGRATLLALTLISGAALAAAAWLTPTPAAAQGSPEAGADPDGPAGDPDGAADGGDAGDAVGARQAAGTDGADAAEAVDIDSLRREYLALRDRLFRSRARAAAVASTLYSSKLRIELVYGSPRYYTVTRATVRLDGANVYDDTSGAVASDRAPRFEGFVAPGRHQIAVAVEAAGKDDERFSTTQATTFTIQVPPGKNVKVTVTAKDDGDIPYQWQREERGTYQLGLMVDVQTFTRERDGKPNPKKMRIKDKNGEASRAPAPAPRARARKSARVTSRAAR